MENQMENNMDMKWPKLYPFDYLMTVIGPQLLPKSSLHALEFGV